MHNKTLSMLYKLKKERMPPTCWCCNVWLFFPTICWIYLEVSDIFILDTHTTSPSFVPRHLLGVHFVCVMCWRFIYLSSWCSWLMTCHTAPLTNLHPPESSQDAREHPHSAVRLSVLGFNHSRSWIRLLLGFIRVLFVYRSRFGMDVINLT